MTSGSPTQLILTFSIPLLIGNLFQQLYSMVDTAIVGRYIGVQALAAVGATGCLSFLIVDFVIGLTAGFAIPISQAFGANDKDRMRHYVAMSIYLSVFISVVMTLLSVACTMPLLKLMRTPADIIDQAYNYIVVIFIGLGAAVFYNMIAGILRALGDSKTPLYFLILSSVINIVLDLVFILKYKTGVEGAAYATVIAQGVSGVLCLAYTIKHHHILHLKKKDFQYNHNSIMRLLHNGLPMALQYSITAIGVMVLQSAVNSLGSMIVAAYTAASKVEQFAMLPFKTLGITMATYAGQNLGAGKIERIQKGIRSSMVMCVICAFLSGALIMLWGPEMLGLFITKGPESAAVIEAAMYYLRLAVIFFIPLGIIFVYRNTLQGMGEGVITMLAGVTELVARCVVALGFTASFGYLAVCLATPAAWVAAAVFLLIVYYVKIKGYKAAGY